MASTLEKDYEKIMLKEEGGKVAIKGFNFQHYAGMYYMIFLFKNEKKFKVEFEKADDITVEIFEGEKYKIQAKTSKITAGYLTKKGKNEKGEPTLSILEKLFSIQGYDYYKICFPLNKCASLDTMKKTSGNGIGENSFTVNIESTKYEKIRQLLIEKNISENNFLLQELEFLDSADHAVTHLVGFARSGRKGKKLEIDEERLDTLLGKIYREIDSGTICIDESYFLELNEVNLLEKQINYCLGRIRDEINSDKEAKYERAIHRYKRKMEYYKMTFSSVKLVDIGNKKFVDYFLENLENFPLEIKEDENIKGAHIILSYAKKVVANAIED